MHKETFNKDFFVVAATIIPILYLALTLQGQTYERMINRAIKEELGGGGRISSETLLSAGIVVTTYVIVAVTALGEGAAILALYNKSASHSTASGVLFSLFVLLIAVVAGPALRNLGLVFGWEIHKAKKAKTASKESSE